MQLRLQRVQLHVERGELADVAVDEALDLGAQRRKLGLLREQAALQRAEGDAPLLEVLPCDRVVRVAAVHEPIVASEPAAQK